MCSKLQIVLVPAGIRKPCTYTMMRRKKIAVQDIFEKQSMYADVLPKPRDEFVISSVRVARKVEVLDAARLINH